MLGLAGLERPSGPAFTRKRQVGQYLNRVRPLADALCLRWRARRRMSALGRLRSSYPLLSEGAKLTFAIITVAFTIWLVTKFLRLER